MYNKGDSIPIFLQESMFLKMFPQFKRKKYNRDRHIIVEGHLQPTPLSKTYRVKIDYIFKTRPMITLPEENFSSERPPHTFQEGDLCLYHKDGDGAWTSKNSMIDLIPMISHWLWCYELWQVTDVWYGDEYPHDLLEPKVAS